ncbi:MAG: VOC family protein [Gammaproteobacteria bacterium]|nr:VOC family protein [Gammaproteobacteria bacterium]MDD9960071.1 VOC family protein [Gammaproteobacteria bacterium]
MTEENQQTEQEAQDETPNNIGKIEWFDLTVDDASRVKDFYCSVVGWSSTEHDMGSYSDYNINLPDTTNSIAGICHARGGNANLPPQWLAYVRVASVQESAEKCEKLGGKVVDGPRRLGNMRFCVIQDPAGAVLALMSAD